MAENEYKWMEELEGPMAQLEKIGFVPYGYNYGTITVRAPLHGSSCQHTLLTCTPADVEIIVGKINELAGKEIL